MHQMLTSHVIEKYGEIELSFSHYNDNIFFYEYRTENLLIKGTYNEECAYENVKVKNFEYELTSLVIFLNDEEVFNYQFTANFKE